VSIEDPLRIKGGRFGIAFCSWPFPSLVDGDGDEEGPLGSALHFSIQKPNDYNHKKPIRGNETNKVLACLACE
jgi:hypothetical protein